MNGVIIGPKNKKGTRRSYLALGPEVAKWAMVPVTSKEQRTSQNQILDPSTPPGFEHVAHPRIISVDESEHKYDQESSTTEEEGSNALESSPSDNDQEAEAKWGVGKELGLSTRIDSMAVQAIIEELVERKRDHKRKKRKGGRKMKKDGETPKPSDVMSLL